MQNEELLIVKAAGLYSLELEQITISSVLVLSNFTCLITLIFNALNFYFKNLYVHPCHVEYLFQENNS
jgi:hypothetical protein